MEIERLKRTEERYNKAHGAGVFDLEQLKNYTHQIKEKIRYLEKQISQTTSETSKMRLVTPSKQEMSRFAQKAKDALTGLEF